MDAAMTSRTLVPFLAALMVTSVFSPKHDTPIAIGYIRRPHHDAGLKFEADTPNGKRAVELIGPMPAAW